MSLVIILRYYGYLNFFVLFVILDLIPVKYKLSIRRLGAAVWNRSTRLLKSQWVNRGGVNVPRQGVAQNKPPKTLP